LHRLLVLLFGVLVVELGFVAADLVAEGADGPIGPAAVPATELGFVEAGEPFDGGGRAAADVADGQRALGAKLGLR
jgi:hypothetical protein